MAIISRSSLLGLVVARLLPCAAGHDLLGPKEAVGGPPKPTTAQLQMMDMGLSVFMHFSVNPWSSIEHNCVGKSPQCIPASVFDPGNLSTDQWVEAAVAMGAGEICLTAHHEGGFCLWDTKYSNYSVMHSPYGKDVVAQFVASCKKYGVKPCYYMGPNANGWLTNNQSYSATAFVDAQLGMLRELLTAYGTDYVSRLWWDHYPYGCGGLAPCPEGSFPAAWPHFVQMVRELSPSTLICPGPDCDGHGNESGLGSYPVWFPCTPESAHGTELRCGGHAPSSKLAGFHPYEACATMHNGWFCKGTGEERENTYWSPGEIWDHYMGSVGIGWVNTLNAPPGTTGQIPASLVRSMTAFGSALRALQRPVALAARAEGVGVQCRNYTPYVLDMGAVREFNAVITREDLSLGQRVAAYAIDYLDPESGSWRAFPALPPKRTSGTGVHGLSVGAQMIDFVPRTAARRVRFRCTASLAEDGGALLKSFSVHKGERPAEAEREILI